MDRNTKVTLRNRKKMPIVGLGLYKVPSGDKAQQVIKWAFEAGYRHLDTAQIYGNEKDVGRAIQNSNLSRDEIFVTTKLWNDNHSRIRESLEESLEKLQMNTVDLFLMHWPVKDKRLSSWEKLVELQDDGLAHEIGVSNFMSWHLLELFDNSDVKPAVNQIEFNPFLYKDDVKQVCIQNGIILEAYSPLAKGRRLDDPILNKIAKKYNKSPAQIMLRWSLQHNAVVIPKSSNQKRINENIDLFDFEISKDDMEVLNELDENLVTGWNPQTQE